MPDFVIGNRVIRRARKLVGHAHRIEHAPQHVELELQNLQHALLPLGRHVVRQGDAQAMLDIAPRLAQARAEIVVASSVDPWVVGRPGVESRLMDLGGKEFGQRTAGRFLPARATGEIDVGVHRETHAGQHPFLGEDLLAIQPPPLRPGVARLRCRPRCRGHHRGRGSVAAIPGARRGPGSWRESRRPSGDVDLIVEAIGDPALDLLAAGAAGVHGLVEGMVDVVVGALGAQGGFEFCGDMGVSVILFSGNFCGARAGPIASKLAPTGVRWEHKFHVLQKSIVGAGLLAKVSVATARYPCRHKPLRSPAAPAAPARPSLHREWDWCC